MTKTGALPNTSDKNQSILPIPSDKNRSTPPTLSLMKKIGVPLNSSPCPLHISAELSLQGCAKDNYWSFQCCFHINVATCFGKL